MNYYPRIDDLNDAEKIWASDLGESDQGAGGYFFSATQDAHGDVLWAVYDRYQRVVWTHTPTPGAASSNSYREDRW